MDIFNQIPILRSNSIYCLKSISTSNFSSSKNYFTTTESFNGTLLKSYYAGVGSKPDLALFNDLVMSNAVWVDVCPDTLYVNIRMGDIVYDSCGKTFLGPSISLEKNTFLSKPNRLFDFVNRYLKLKPNISNITIVSSLHYLEDHPNSKFLYNSESLRINKQLFEVLYYMLIDFGLPLNVLKTYYTSNEELIDTHFLTLCFADNAILDNSWFSKRVLDFRKFRKKLTYSNSNLLNPLSMKLNIHPLKIPLFYSIPRCASTYFDRRSFYMGYYYYFITTLCSTGKGIPMSLVKYVRIKVGNNLKAVSLILFSKNGIFPETLNKPDDTQFLSVEGSVFLNFIKENKASIFNISIRADGLTPGVADAEKFVDKILQTLNLQAVPCTLFREPFSRTQSVFNTFPEDVPSLEQYIFGSKHIESWVCRHFSNNLEEDVSTIDLDKLHNKLDKFIIYPVEEIDELVDSVYDDCYGFKFSDIMTKFNHVLTYSQDHITAHELDLNFILPEDVVGKKLDESQKQTLSKNILKFEGLKSALKSCFLSKNEFDINLYKRYISK